MADTKDEKDVAPSKESQGDLSSDEDDPQVLPRSAMEEQYSKEFVLNHGDFPWRDVELLEGTKPAFWCENTEVTQNKPDITLHKGGKDGPVIGAAHYRHSRSITVGLGSDDISMDWVKLERKGTLVRSFVFEWKDKQYTLRRAKTGDHGSTGFQKMRLSHFKVTENKSGQIVGLYICKTGIGRQKGTLKLAFGVTPELELLIILGVIGVMNKQSGG